MVPQGLILGPLFSLSIYITFPEAHTNRFTFYSLITLVVSSKAQTITTIETSTNTSTKNSAFYRVNCFIPIDIVIKLPTLSRNIRKCSYKTNTYYGFNYNVKEKYLGAYKYECSNLICYTLVACNTNNNNNNNK